jgi:hypothetical protein
MKSSVTALSLTRGSRIGLDHRDLVEAAAERLLLHPDDRDQPDPNRYARREEKCGFESVRERLP